jgi:tRNA G18 (ribose-2'-O)-methylase SpoU
MRGFFAIGVYRPKASVNIGTLWRSANIFGAAFVFSVAERYKRQPTDTLETWRHIPLMHFESVEDLWEHLPHDAILTGVELDRNASPLKSYIHPERAVYLLGAEDDGLPDDVMRRCMNLVRLPGQRSLNVAVAGSIVMFDRLHQREAVGAYAMEVTET